MTYGYDSSDRLETITDGGQNHLYAYHPNSSLVSSIHSRTGTTAWFRESRHYDTQSRLLGIRSDRMNGASVTAGISSHAYDYDELNRRRTNTFQDGSTAVYGYNDRSEVLSSTRKNAAGTDIPQLNTSYTYDAIGNRLTSNSPVLGNHTYTPNSVNQYASITTGSGRTAVGRAPTGWAVQVAGVNASRIGEIYWRDLTATNTSNPVWQSVVTRSTTPDPDVEKTNYFWYAKTPTVPTYDFDGNLTYDGRWEYKWDAENRLIQMETPSAVTNAPVSHPYTRLVFVYDWQGRRIARHVYKTTSTNLVSSRRWLYDGWNVIAEFSCAIAGVPTTQNPLVRLNTFTWGLDLSGTLQGAGGVGGLLVQTDVTPTAPLGIQRASYDGNGNIVAWTKSDSTAPTSRREYDAFGNTLVSEGAIPCSFGFSTKMQDGETGLYYYGYRYYDPVNGRWPNRDPIGEKGGLNMYGFVFNSPIVFFDDLGHETRSQADATQRQRQIDNSNGQNRNVTDGISNRANSGSATLDEAASSATNAAAAAAEVPGYVAKVMRNEIDTDAMKEAKSSCATLLANSPCKGPSCSNSCMITFRRRYDQGGTPMGNEFILSKPRPCRSCNEEDDPKKGPSLTQAGGPGWGAPYKEIAPAVGVFPPIYEDDKSSFTTDTTCEDILVQ